MRKYIITASFLLLISLFIIPGVFAEKQYIYDDANIFTDNERTDLEQRAAEYSEENEIDILILTKGEQDGIDIEPYIEDFYDEQGPGYDGNHGDTVILGLDFSKGPGDRDLYVAGFYEGEKYIDSDRGQQIVDQIIPNLSANDYYDASLLYFEKVDKYMGVSPLVNPDGFLLQTWFHLLVAVIIGAAVVGSMIFNMGGRVTTNASTYLDANNSRVKNKSDRYLRQTVTKTKIQKNTGGGRGGGGGGMTRGGHSHSGARGKF
ncbi:TPM domain-containing protein [Oceanobacillus sojae]|uniref:Methanol dehydrogenase n=1 Tax=Oceanobacillus sojae TaxID=582851 RepID=A0A511ZMR8_9BACI|nr:TPM domain-containing protein [Oceanobacillus sojae]GEN88730.1 methanol dehydrogenase [Oceanobacillus sojae]